MLEVSDNNRVIPFGLIKGSFEEIYVMYSPRMLRFAKEYVLSDEEAENIVQDVFMVLWEKREFLDIRMSISSYLFSLVRNKCLDFLKRKIVVDTYKQELTMKMQALEQMEQMYMSDEEIEQILTTAINKLPERCRLIFVKSRIEGKKYREIAEELNLSVNTVENQMGLALKKLRVELREYLPLFIFLCLIS
ncbi:RNA polymerase sigma-70 factor [uncultured Parabacteroides sp.]|uniref:RNA polymerase sigma-70 factor n=1 Tax=uncultured Parabacteroides sp. TaxID=512312 RepID=UPI00262EB0F7|nr:RNA polymerase sigma-70 factor [uncultured Parabacteroides sp.]